jgi:hypothetical protein
VLSGNQIMPASCRMRGRVSVGWISSIAWAWESSALVVLGMSLHCRGGRVVEGRGFVSLEELNAPIRRLILACVAVLDVTGRAKLRSICIDALPWQVSRRDSIDWDWRSWDPARDWRSWDSTRDWRIWDSTQNSRSLDSTRLAQGVGTRLAWRNELELDLLGARSVGRESKSK